MAFRTPRTHRIFYYITAAITMTASIAYFTMASNLGYAAIAQEFIRSDPQVSGIYREVFYVRYIDWVVTTPVSLLQPNCDFNHLTDNLQLLLMDILLTAGLPWPTILYTLFIDEIMIITGLVGALVVSRYKWGYFVFAMFALFFVAYNVLFVGRKHAKNISAEVGKTYNICGAWTMFLWFLYPIAWGLCEGGNVISPDSEAVFYGVLDVLAKPVFGALLIWGHRNIDPATLGLHIRDYDEPLIGPNNNNGYTEKHGNHHGLAGGPVTGNSTGVHGDTTMPATTGVHNNTSAV